MRLQHCGSHLVLQLNTFWSVHGNFPAKVFVTLAGVWCEFVKTQRRFDLRKPHVPSCPHQGTVAKVKWRQSGTHRKSDVGVAKAAQLPHNHFRCVLIWPGYVHLYGRYLCFVSATAMRLFSYMMFLTSINKFFPSFVNLFQFQRVY